MRFAAAAFFLLFVGACNRPRYDTPVNAYVSFSRAVQKEDLREAFKGLSSPTRDVLTQRAKELSKASGGSMRSEPALYLFTPGVRAPDVTSVQVVKEDGQKALLEVESGGKKQQVQLVKEAEGWRVDLTEALQKSAPQSAPDGAAAPG